MTGRASEWRARVFLVLASLALTLFAAEGAARFLLRPARLRLAEGTPISELSPSLGWRARPSGSQHLRREDFDVTISINAKGLRGPDLPYQAVPPRRRLAIMGDSYASGYYAEEAETLAARLGQALQSCQVDVLNAGQPGYSTDQEWLFFNEEIRKYDPREVLLLFFYNDLSFNIEPASSNRAKPLFIERGGSLELILPAMSFPDGGEVLRDGEPPPMFHRSALWRFAADRLLRVSPGGSRALARYGLVPEISTVPPREFLPFGPMETGEKAGVEEMWNRTATILRGFRDEVRVRGAGFSVFYVPSRMEVNDDAWNFVLRRFEPARPWRRDAVRTRLAQLLATLDIPLVEANRAFATAEKSHRLAYLPVDGHWNARGNEIAFESVLPLMRRAFDCAP